VLWTWHPHCEDPVLQPGFDPVRIYSDGQRRTVTEGPRPASAVPEHADALAVAGLPANG